MKKSAYRKFIIRGETGNDDFASMREAVERRYRRVQAEHGTMPSLILVDGGIGQLHAAAAALERLEIINRPLASIAKKEEIIYVHGQEDEPVILERHSPILHFVQQIRDETHRFAIAFHRQRRTARHLRSELIGVPGIGERTAHKLLRRFGSIANLRRATLDELSKVIPRRQAERLLDHLRANAKAVPPAK